MLGWARPQGLWAILAIGLLLVEAIITLADFVEEDRSRRLPASERVTHTLLALNYGAILVLLLPMLIEWAARPTGIKPVSYGFWSILAAASAAGVALFGLRDLAASKRLARLNSAPATCLVDGLTG